MMNSQVMQNVHMRVRPSWLLVLAVVGLSVGFDAQAILVQDTGASTASTCTLAQAINAANAANGITAASVGSVTPVGTCSGATADFNIISFTGWPTITLTSVDNYWYGPNALPPIASPMLIGPSYFGGTGATLVAAHTGDPTPATSNAFRFFYVSGGMELPAGSLFLFDMTLQGGYAKGGDSTGGGGAGMGGAIFNQGGLTLQNVSLIGNAAQGGNFINYVTVFGGGGMGQDAFSYNEGGGFGGPLGGSYGGAGGAQNGQFTGGGGGFIAGSDGGAPSGGGNGGVGGVGDGGAAGDGGGGNGNNYGPGGGGGGFGFGGGGGFGAGQGPRSYSTGGAGMGGAIFNHTGTVSLLNVTASRNAANGGVSDNPNYNASGLGAVLFNLNGSVTIDFSTLAGNSLTHKNGGADNVGPADGAVYSLAYGNKIQDGTASSASLTIHNSIIHGTSGVTNADVAANLVNGNNTNASSLTYSGKNLVGSSYTVVGVTQTGASPITADPLLGPAGLYSGLPSPIPVMPIGSNSPAYNAAPSCLQVDGSSALGSDARGTARPYAGTCDIGAYEFDGDYIFANGFDAAL